MEFIEMNKEGAFSLELSGIEKNREYEFRAVVIHPRMSIYGDTRRFKP